MKTITTQPQGVTQMTIARVVGSFGDGGLTTDHAASSYGQPVLVIDGTAYGPNDAVNCSAGDDVWCERAADVVERATVLTPSIPDDESDHQAWQAENRKLYDLRDRFCRLGKV